MSIEDKKAELFSCGWQETSIEPYWFPATYSQRALWFIQDLNPENLAYNIPIGYDIRGNLMPQQLARAIGCVFDQHEAIRTTFSEDGGEVYQVIRDTAGFQVPIVDFSDSPKEELGALVDDLINTWIAEKFNLATGPLARAAIIAAGPDHHVLLLAIHHSIIDHLSLMMVMDDIMKAYSELAGGRDPSFQEAELQYPDFAVWQREAQTRETLADKIAFWKDNISEQVGCIDLPLDRPRPGMQSFSGQELRTTIPADVSSLADAFSRTNGVSLFVTMLAAYYVLLHRYSRQELLIVGVPFGNRIQAEMERVVGLFINTLPLPLKLEGTMRFEDVVKAARGVANSVQGNQETPLEFIMEALRPQRDPSFNPLFQVGFTLQDPPVDLAIAGLSIVDLELHSSASMYDLHTWLWQKPSGDMGFQVWYDDAIFDLATIKRFCQHYIHLVRACVENPGLPIGEIPLALPEEIRLMETWNQTEQGSDEPDLVPASLFCRPRDANKTAVVCGNDVMSHGDLEVCARKIADFLAAQGVVAGDRVGVLMDRRLELVPTLLGIMQLGAAYVPLDPQHPADRIAYILKDAGVSVLCAESGTAGLLTEAEYQVILIDEDWQAISTQTGDVHTPVSDPESVAYVIYTSGSTGRPKGVMVPHRAVANFLRAAAEMPGFQGDDTLLAVTTISFDISVLELLLPVLCGGTVVVGQRDVVADGKQLMARLAQGDITVIQATPATFRMLFQSGWTGDNNLNVFCGGEALPKDLVAELQPKVAALWNLYGPTECTVWCTTTKIMDPAAVIRIGRPMPNYRAYVLDEHQQPQALGVAGELYIAGGGVALGYHNRPELTAEKFVPDAFTKNGLMYATGDLARWTDNGELEHLGRIDTQVKIRGFRIELGEIEATLATHDNIQEVVAAVKQFGATDQRIVAYLVMESGKSLQTNEVRKLLRQQLPDYMIPAHFVVIEAVPLSPSGKVDRTRLPDPAQALAGTEAFDPPRTKTEKLVAEIWQEIIGTPNVGRDANFFSIGGHSLIAIKAIHLIKEQTGFELPLRKVILENLATLAEMIDDGVPVEEPAPTEPTSGLTVGVRQLKSWVTGLKFRN